MAESAKPVYSIEIKPTALKSLSHLPKKHQEQIRKSIDALAANPRPVGVEKIKGELTLHRIRSGVYRVVYDIFDSSISVCVVRIAHRRDVSRNL